MTANGSSFARPGREAQVTRVATALAKGDLDAYRFLFSAATKLARAGEPLNDGRVLAEAKRLRGNAELAKKRNAAKRKRWAA